VAAHLHFQCKHQTLPIDPQVIFSGVLHPEYVEIQIGSFKAFLRVTDNFSGAMRCIHADHPQNTMSVLKKWPFQTEDTSYNTSKNGDAGVVVVSVLQLCNHNIVCVLF
jgi:hypothetical protein